MIKRLLFEMLKRLNFVRCCVKEAILNLAILHKLKVLKSMEIKGKSNKQQLKDREITMAKTKIKKIQKQILIIF